MMPIDLAAAVEHGVGDLAHQSDRSAAIDKADAVSARMVPSVRAACTKAGSEPGPEPQ